MQKFNGIALFVLAALSLPEGAGSPACARDAVKSGTTAEKQLEAKPPKAARLPLYFSEPDDLNTLKYFYDKCKGVAASDQDALYIGSYFAMKKDFENCQNFCKNTLSAHPNWVTPYLCLAQLAQKNFEVEEGLSYCRKALAINPQCINILELYCKQLRNECHYEEALKVADQGLRVVEERKNEIPVNNLAVCKAKFLVLKSKTLRALKKNKEAISCMETLKSLRRGTSIIHLELAETLIAEKQPERAINICSEALKINANDFDYYLMRAKAYKLAGQTQKAIDDLTTFINITAVKAPLKPPTQEARRLRAELCDQVGQKQMASQDRAYLKNLINTGYSDAPFRSTEIKEGGTK